MIGNLWRNLKSRGLKDVTNVKTVKSYLDWEDIKANGLTIEAGEILAFSEQILYRKLRCKPCFDNGECLHCHCEIRGKLSSPRATCSELKWEEIMPEKDWLEYKEVNRINIILV